VVRNRFDAVALCGRARDTRGRIVLNILTKRNAGRRTGLMLREGVFE
jgi:hypothetical protein